MATTLERIRAEAVAAEQQMEQLRAQATGESIAPAPNAPASNEDTPPAPQPVDNQFGHGTPVETPPESGNGPITAEQFAQLQQQLSTMQGRFDQQTQRLAEVTGRAQLLERMALLRQEHDRDTPPPAPVQRTKRQIANPNLIKEYGDELVGLVRDIITEEVEFTLAPLIDQIQALGATVGNINQSTQHVYSQVASNAEQRYNDEMDALVVDGNGNSDWRAINTMHGRGDTRFVDWLQKTGEDSDEPRQLVLDRAYQRKDAKKCAAFFNKFKAEFGLPNGHATERPATSTPPVQAAALVSPSPAAPAAPSTTRGQKGATYKMSEVNKHYDDKTKGYWKGREAEWRTKAAEFDKAVLEGRIIDDVKRL